MGVKDWLAFLGPALIRTFDRGGGQAAKDQDIALHSPVLAVLGTNADDVPSWIAAGQALQHPAPRVPKVFGLHSQPANRRSPVQEFA
jgi:hypothetical protein